MKIEFNDYLFEIEDEEIQEVKSVKTGKLLKKIHGRVNISNTHNPKDFNTLKKVNILNDDEIYEVFDLKINSSSHSNVSSYWSFDILCDEIEEYTVSRVIIDNTLILNPYEYKEEVDSTALIMLFKVVVNKDNFIKIKDMHKQRYISDEKIYFSVKRANFIEKEMRFGQPKWEKVNENEYKLSLVLVEKLYDLKPSKTSGFLDPDFSNLKTMVSENRSKLNSLIKLLEEKKVIHQEEISLFKDAYDSDYAEDMFLLKKVRDINEE